MNVWSVRILKTQLVSWPLVDGLCLFASHRFTLRFISFSLLTCFLCMTWTDMRLTFTKHREAARRAREATINCSTPNRARAVECASLATTAAKSLGDAATLLGDAATPTTTRGTLAGQSPQMAWLGNRSKGKEPIQSSGKRTSEVEPSRKRTSQGPRPIDSASLREVAPTTAQALAL